MYAENQCVSMLITLLIKNCQKNTYFLVSFGNSEYFCKTSFKRKKHGTNNQTTTVL